MEDATKGPIAGPLLTSTSNLLLKLFEELARRAGDVHSTRNSALTVLDTLDDAGRFGALRTIRALVGIHDLFTVAGLGNLRHNACSPWYKCFGSRAGCLMVYPTLRQAVSKSSGTSRKDCTGQATAGIGGEELRLRLFKEFTRERLLLKLRRRGRMNQRPGGGRCGRLA